MKTKSSLLALAAALFGFAGINSAPAASLYWDTTTDPGLLSGTGTWDTNATALWSPDTAGTSLVVWTGSDDAFFQTGGVNTVTIGSGSMTAISLTQTGAGTQTTIAGSGTLTLTGTAFGTSVIVNSGNQLLTINAPIVTTRGGSIINASGGDIAINGNMTLTNGLVKSGNYNLTLSGSNTTTGNGSIAVAAGTLTMTTINALPTTAGYLQLGSGGANGTFVYNSTGASAASTDRQVQIGGNSTLAGSAIINNNSADPGASISFTSGTFNYTPVTTSTSGNRTITLGGSNTGNNEIRGVITNNNWATTGTISLTKADVGKWILSGSNSYSGGTTLSAGVLQLGNANALGSGVLTINSGSLDSSVANLVNAGNNAQTWSGNFTFVGTQNLDLGTGAVTLSAARTVTVTANTLTVGGAISGAFGLTKSGSGTLVLTGASAYTGATTISSGTLQIGSGGTTGALSTSSAITNNASLIFNRSDTITAGTDFKGAIAGTGSVTLSGGGSVNFGSADNSFSGGLYIYNGTAIGNNAKSSLGATGGYIYLGQIGGTNSATVYNNRGTTDVTYNVVVQAADPSAILTIGKSNFTGQWNGTITLNHDVTLNCNSSVYPTLLFNSTISGSYGVVVANGASSATVILGGSNTYTGQTQINTGALRLANANAAQNSIISIGGNGLGFDNTTSGTSTYTIGGLGGSGNLVLTDTGSNPVTLNLGNNNNTASYSGVLSGSGALSKTGTGTQILSGTNTYTGNTVISAGTLQIGTGGTSGALSTSSTITNNGTLAFNRSNVVTQGTDFSASAITGTGGLTQAGTGRLTLTAANSYSGPTTISSGTLQIGNSGTTGALSASSAISNNGTLAFNRTNTITQGTDFGTITGTGALIQSGAGTLTLSNSNSYSGGTTISTGTLAVSGVGTLGAPTGALAMAGGTLDLGSTAQTVGAVTITAPATIQSGTLTGSSYAISHTTGTANVSAVLAGNGVALTKSGAGTLTLSGSNSYSGGTTLSAGVLQLGNANALGSGTLTILGGSLDSSVANLVNAGNNAQAWNGNFTFGGTQNLDLGTGAVTLNAARTVTITANTLTVGGAISGATFGLTKSGSGTLVLTGSSAYTGATTISTGTLQIGNGGTTGALSTASAITTNASLVFNRSNTMTAGTDFKNSISGTGSLTILGSGTVDLGTSNSFSGGLYVYNGTVIGQNTQQNLGVLNGNIYLGQIGSLNSATLFNNRGSNDVSYNVIVQAADPTAVLTIGKSQYVGGWNGTIVLNHDVTLNNTLVNDTQLFNSTISGSYGVIVASNATGTVNLTGTNTFTGGVTIRTGALRVGSAGALNSTTPNNLSLTSGTATLDLNGYSITVGTLSGSTGAIITSNSTASTQTLTASSAADSTYAGTIRSGSGTVGFTKSGVGTLTLSGSNGYTGATTINAGTLAISSTNGLAGTSGVSMSGGAALAYTGSAATFAKNITVSSGTGTVRNSGTGTLTLSGTLSKDGSVLRLNGGSFNVTGNIIGASSNSDLLVDAATVTLSGSNSYNGPTYIINSGTLNANVANALPTANGRTDVSMDQSGSGNSRLSLGTSQSIASLTGAATSTVNLGANTLTIGASSGNNTFAGVISGAGALTKDGNSVQVLSGSNTYTGVTNVTGGRLLVSGSLAGTTSVSVSSGAELNVNGLVNTSASIGLAGTLSGSGTVGNVTVQSGGVLAPGNGLGILTTGSLSLVSGGRYDLELNNTAGTAGTNWDQVSASALDLSQLSSTNKFTLSLKTLLSDNSSSGSLTGFNPSSNYTWAAVIKYGNLIGTFNSNLFTIDTTGFLNTFDGSFSLASNGSQIDLQYLAIPEPSVIGSVLSGFGMLLLFQRGRRRRS